MTDETGRLAEHEIGAAKIEGASDRLMGNQVKPLDILFASAVAWSALAAAMGPQVSSGAVRLIHEAAAKRNYPDAVLAALGTFTSPLEP